MIKRIISIMFFTASVMIVFAQHSAVFTQADKPFHEGKELYDQRKYAASYRSFEQFLKQTPVTNAGMIQEAEYYLACNAYELRQENAEKLLKEYLENHPYTPYLDRTNYLLGMLQYEAKRYENALYYFRQVDETHLINSEKTDYLFSRGYANLAINETRKALDIFKTLKNMQSSHQAAARYYTGYSEYKLGNYDAALSDLLAVEQNADFEDIAPYYIAQIYYLKNNFQEMEKRANLLLKKYPKSINNAELYRMIGEKAYSDGNYFKAIDNLKKYEEIAPKVLRNNMYYLGISYLKTSQPTEAIKYLSKVTAGQDEMAESAYLQLGNAYLATGDKNNARMAFEAATQTNFNTSVREEALYNYALTTYETGTAFGESVKAFEQFISEFPNSKNIDKAYDYLSTTYLTSKNYDAAYKSIQKIKNLTQKLQETKQYLEYQLGTESFTASSYPRAIEYFTRALQTSPNGRYSADAYYWRAESFYRTKDFAKTASDLANFFNQPNVQNNPNYLQALYSMGYAYFGQKKYDQSLTWFQKYIGSEKNTASATYSDALNRIGDAYYSQRNFGKATENYQKAISASPYNADYALFQSAYMAGIEKDYNRKIDLLEQLQEKYPNSQYGDEALYEIGRSYTMLENNPKIIATYQKLINKYPNSALAPKAELETGMVYYNVNDYKNAIPAFKKVIADYPASEQAEIALESLESIYVNTNKVDEYLDYTKSLGRNIENSSIQRADSILFTAAEKQYIAANYTQAISSLINYLNRYCPAGKYCVTAQYYLADSYYVTNDKTKALTEYAKILDTRGNPYMEDAAKRAAEISFDEKDYTASLKYFKILQDFAQSTENKNIGRLGVLRSSYFLNNMTETVQIANSIISDPKSTSAMINEARLNRAKVLIQQNKMTDALQDLKAITIDTRTSIGAEAKYTLSETYFKLNKLNESEKEVLDFAKKGTPYQYWLARSFIVLSDVNILKGDDFQAKQYLLSLQKNYTAKDDIQGMINDRLNAINVRTNQKVTN